MKEIYKASILVVDDTSANLQVMAGVLRGQNYEVRPVPSGKLALQAVENNPPDLILLDINMPEMDGYEVCRILKSSEKTKDIPIIFITALNETENEIKGFELGAADYITKPINPHIVLARVKTHIMLKYIREQLMIKNQFLEYTFSRYVSAKVLDRLKTTPVEEFLTMERRDITVLFCDMRGFTLLGNELAPEDIYETVNSFLEAMVGCIDKFDGTIDKFLGDGLMAFFGAPLKQENHARRAMNAAIAMQKAHDEWMIKRLEKAKPARPLGIGVASGAVVVGNIGTQNRMEYTVLGHTVNLASRLCAAADGGEILTTFETLLQLNSDERPSEGIPDIMPFDFSPKEPMAFKNIAEPIKVFALFEKICGPKVLVNKPDAASGHEDDVS
jgi:class 3 adenylate cyclase